MSEHKTGGGGTAGTTVQLSQRVVSHPQASIRVESIQIPREVKTAVSRALSKPAK